MDKSAIVCDASVMSAEICFVLRWLPDLIRSEFLGVEERWIGFNAVFVRVYVCVIEVC